jgi:DNA-binding CsgD family transcriptional regulator
MFNYSGNLVNTVNLPATSALDFGCPLLGKPDFFLSFLVETLDEEFVFYSLDSSWRFVYLSGSAKKVLGMTPSEWVGRPLREALSNSDCNLPIRNMEMSVSPLVDSIKGTCEFVANGQLARKLEYRHARILQNQVPIGYAGIAYPPAKIDEGPDCDALMAKVRSLSPVERQVIEFVFNGRQNKSIAAELKVAVRTIESRRARAMAKLQVVTLADMVKLWSRVPCLPNDLERSEYALSCE